MRNRLRRLARRLLHKIAQRRRRDVRPQAPVDAAHEDAAAKLQLRLAWLERLVLAEMDRARKAEATRLRYERIGAGSQPDLAAALATLDSTFERRSSFLADRIVVLQRDLDAHRTVANELGRDVLLQRAVAERSSQIIDAIGRDLVNLRVALESAVTDIGSTQQSLLERVDGLSDAALDGQRDMSNLRVVLESAVKDVGSTQRSLIERIDGISDAVQGGGELASVLQHLTALTAGVQSLESRSLATLAEVRGLQNDTQSLQDHFNAAQRQFADLLHRHRVTPFMAGPIFGSTDGPPRDPSATFDYLGFEEIFRGSGDLVRERQRPYLEFIKPGQRVIELGTGRGEFLELAGEAGAVAVGVDSNRQMVEACRERGLEVHEGDALAFLRETSPGSADLVFSAQFIEHLAPADLYALFVCARRVLTPGGVMIAETVNPHSIEALKCFYVDLTHVKPLFPEVMLFFARSAGFSQGRIFYPTGGGFDEAEPWNRGEYALIATA